jgi:hypothetical protein
MRLICGSRSAAAIRLKEVYSARLKAIAEFVDALPSRCQQCMPSVKVRSMFGAPGVFVAMASAGLRFHRAQTHNAARAEYVRWAALAWSLGP